MAKDIKNAKRPFKIFCLSLLAILLFLLPSCAAKGDTHFNNEIFNGIEFTHLVDIKYKSKDYSIYRPVNISLIDDEKSVKDQSLLYVYQPLDVPSVDDWRINYYYSYRCLSDNLSLDKELTKLLFDNMEPILLQYEERVEIEFERYDLTGQNHHEFHIKDTLADEVYLTVLYIPFYIINQSNLETYNVLIPVSTFLAYRYDDKVLFDYGNVQKEISYNTFLSLSNISNIEERGNKYV